MPSDRENLFNTLYASSVEVPSWVSFTRLARDLLRCDQVAVMVHSGRDETPVGTYADDLAIAEIAACFPLHPDAARPCPVYRCATDNGTALILSVTDTQQRSASIALWRQGRDATFSRTTQDTLATLTEPLRTCLSIYYRVVDSTRQRALSDIALETSRIGVALVGVDGELLTANSITRQFLDNKDGLRLVNGKLRADSSEETQALLDEIRRCALDQKPEANTAIYAPLAFTRRDQALPLTAVVRPGPGYSPLPRPLQRTAILVLRDPALQAPWPAAALARLFNLSNAEANLASELAKGASIDEASATLGISRNTARTQLKSIFLKTGINRQSDLIRALLNSGASST